VVGEVPDLFGLALSFFAFCPLAARKAGPEVAFKEVNQRFSARRRCERLPHEISDKLFSFCRIVNACSMR
jgi:hypothetical protein